MHYKRISSRIHHKGHQNKYGNVSMEHKIVDINELVIFLAGTAMQPLLKDDLWQCYGYGKRPKTGNILNKMFPKKYELENFISKEVLTMSLIDVLNGIKKSKVSSDTKLLISIGVIDQFLSTTQHLFTPDSFMDNLFTSYTSFLKCDKSKLHEPIILKAKDILDKKDFAKFMVGTIKLLAMEHADDYLLKSDYFRDAIDKSSLLAETKLKIEMPEEMYKKYGALLSKKILNT